MDAQEILTIIHNAIRSDLRTVRERLGSENRFSMVTVEESDGNMTAQSRFISTLLSVLIIWRNNVSDEQIESEVRRIHNEKKHELSETSDASERFVILGSIIRTLGARLNYPIRTRKHYLGSASVYMEYNLKEFANEQKINTNEYADEVIRYIESKLVEDLRAIQFGSLSAQQLRKNRSVGEFISRLHEDKEYIHGNVEISPGRVKIKREIAEAITQYISENRDEILGEMNAESDEIALNRTAHTVIMECFRGDEYDAYLRFGGYKVYVANKLNHLRKLNEDGAHHMEHRENVIPITSKKK